MCCQRKRQFRSRSGRRRLLPAQASFIRAADAFAGPIDCSRLSGLTPGALRGVDAAPTIDEDGQAIREALARNRAAWPERIRPDTLAQSA
jgi:hypothetical protein